MSTLQGMTDWSHEAIEAQIRALQEQHDWKKSQYFMMLRIGSTGRKATPPLFETMQAIGRDAVVQRLRKLHDLL